MGLLLSRAKAGPDWAENGKLAKSCLPSVPTQPARVTGEGGMILIQGVLDGLALQGGHLDNVQ